MHVGGGSATVDSSGGPSGSRRRRPREHHETGTLYANRFRGESRSSSSTRRATSTHHRHAGHGIFATPHVQPAATSRRRIRRRAIGTRADRPSLPRYSAAEGRSLPRAARVGRQRVHRRGGRGRRVDGTATATGLLDHGSHALVVRAPSRSSAAGLTASRYTDSPTPKPGGHVADFNGDGRPDSRVARGCDRGTRRRKPSSLRARPRAATGRPGTFGNAVRTGDVNGDGYAISSSARATIRRCPRVLRRRVGLPSRRARRSRPFRQRQVADGDARINGDGYGDLAR